jgi:hypothetical protein
MPIRYAMHVKMKNIYRIHIADNISITLCFLFLTKLFQISVFIKKAAINDAAQGTQTTVRDRLF